MNYPPLWQLHNAYKKHSLIIIATTNDQGVQLNIGYCPCGRFYINRLSNSIWDSTSARTARGRLIRLAILATAKPDIISLWQAYIAIVKGLNMVGSDASALNL